MYKFSHLTFGKKVVPAIFHQVMDTMLRDLDFSVSYLDYILLKRKNTEKHRKNVLEVFRRIQDYGFKLKAETFDFLCIKSNI